MKRYNKIAELPDWAKEPVQRLCALGVLNGRGGLPDEEGYPTGLDLSYDMLRLAVMLDRTTGGFTTRKAGSGTARRPLPESGGKV